MMTSITTSGLLMLVLWVVPAGVLAGETTAFDTPSLFVNRAAKTFSVVDEKGEVVRTFPCSIGKGGLGTKETMADAITPTGDFTVDLILSEDARFVTIAEPLRKLYRYHANASMVQTRDGLSKMFAEMNRLDFDRDGRPDRAYGAAYIGLASSTAVTGPKLSLHRGMPYWFSIAIHGTPDEAKLGTATSGGCVHLAADSLQWLLTSGVVKIGTVVRIRDSAP